VQPVVTYTPSDPISLHFLVVFIQNVVAFFFSYHFLIFMYVLASVILIAFITLILYLLVRLYEIKVADDKKKKATITPTAMPVSPNSDIPMAPPENQTWKHIRERLLSNSDSDWKLGVIEGDIYLDKVLDDKGFHGETTGDKLKQVTPDKLPSIQMAWEAHKIRNRIAHDGAAFVLTMPEARRLLSYYEVIFTDFGVI
jgi:hypothetical protein